MRGGGYYGFISGFEDKYDMLENTWGGGVKYGDHNMQRRKGHVQCFECISISLTILGK